MRYLKILFVSTVLLSACSTPEAVTNGLKIGMSPEDVTSLIGSPDSTAISIGQRCYSYSQGDISNRQPLDYSDRYYTCFKNDRLVSFGDVWDK